MIEEFLTADQIELRTSKKILDKLKTSAILLKVYFIKLISSYNVLQITKQISFYTVLTAFTKIGERIRNSSGSLKHP